MTLIISALSTRVVAHVSDTRHTYLDSRTGNSTRHADKKVKSIVILGDAGCFLISYCGRGEIDGATTDIWLTNLMTDFGSGKKKISETITHLQCELDRVSDSSKDHHRITVLISGVEMLDGKGALFQCVLTNFEKNINGRLVQQANAGKFELHYLNAKTPTNSNPTAILVLGAEAATKSKHFNSRMKKTVKLLKAWRRGKNEDMKSALAQLVKIAARDEKYGHYISETCIVTILPLDSWEPEATYFGDSTHEEGILPHLIGPNISFREVSFTGGDSLTLHTY